MSNRVRRSFAALTAAALGVAALTACGGPSDSEVNLGAILPITGTYSTYGGPIRQAAEMAVERVNDSGGITVNDKTYTLKLQVYDDATTPAKSLPSVFPQAVLRDHSPLLIAAWNSANIAPFLKDNPVPVIDVLAATYEPPVNSLDDNIFLLRPYTPDIIPGVGHYLADNYNAKRIAFIGPNESFANGQLESLKLSLPDNGQELVGNVSYPPDATDLSSFIGSVLHSNPDSVHVGGSTQAVAPVISQLRLAGYEGPITMYTGMTPDQARDLIGADLYNNVMEGVHEFEGVTPQTNPRPAAIQFGKDFENRYDTYGIDLTQWAYDAVLIARAAMEQAGTVTDSDAIRDALAEMTIPSETVTGWIPREGEQLFDSRRQATSLSVGLAWDATEKAWSPDFYFTAGLPDQEVTVVDSPTEK